MNWKKRKPLPKRNEKRLKRLRAKQFGTDGKREWILSLPSIVSNERGWEGNPIDPCHVLGTRGAGHGPEGMAPMLRSEHIDFDGSMTDERFEEKYGISREVIREKTRALHEEWKTLAEG